MTAVASRIVNDVSYVTRINHESDSSWQAQYLVMLEGGTCCSPCLNVPMSPFSLNVPISPGLSLKVWSSSEYVI